MNIIDEGPCTAQWTHPFVKLATILLSRERLLCSLLFGNSTKVPGSRPLRKRQKQKSAAHLNRQNDVKNRKHTKIQLTFLRFCPPTQRQVKVIGKKCKFSSKSSLKIIFFIYAFVTFQCILIYCLLS